jgi:hypothetical protein
MTLTAETANSIAFEGADVVTKIDALGETPKALVGRSFGESSAAKGAFSCGYLANYHLHTSRATTGPAFGLTLVAPFSGAIQGSSLTGQSDAEKVISNFDRLAASYYVARASELVGVKALGAAGRCIVETMEAAKPRWEKYEESHPSAPSRRALQAAPELYPELDFDRMRSRASELRDAPSDSAAITRLLGRPGRAGHQAT